MGLDEHNVPRLLRSGRGHRRLMTGTFFGTSKKTFDDYGLSFQKDQARSRGGCASRAEFTTPRQWCCSAGSSETAVVFVVAGRARVTGVCAGARNAYATGGGAASPRRNVQARRHSVFCFGLEVEHVRVRCSSNKPPLFLRKSAERGGALYSTA